MTKRSIAAMCALVLGIGFTVAAAQEYPLWERLLQHAGGTTDETPVPSMKMGSHMQMSMRAKAVAGDSARADLIVKAAQSVLARYADVKTALRDGYKPFFPTGKLGEEVHYTNYAFARKERQQVDYEHPGSILYKRTADGMKAVGVMYTAPQDSTPAQLNRVAPLSVATWHRHVDFCGWPRSAPLDARIGPQARFGVQGSIHTEAACKEAHGIWIPVVFGWMTHVYPNGKTAHEMWGGMEMPMEANPIDANPDSGEPAH